MAAKTQPADSSAERNPFGQGLIPLADAVRLLPRRRGGKKAHVSTLFRWAQVGLRGVRLEIVQCGGTKCVTQAALSEFFQRLGNAHNPRPIVRTPAQRARAIDRADAELDQAGA